MSFLKRIGKAIRQWLRDAVGIFNAELKEILHDEGVMVIFIIAGFCYPILYNLIYSHGTLDDISVAVVDESHSSESRRFIREMDATREIHIVGECLNMEEAKFLMQEREINGIIYFPSDFDDNIANIRTAMFSVYADMSSFLYFKSLLMGSNFVMLHNLRKIQIDRFSALGMTGQETSQLVQPLRYEDNNPFNPTFSYSIFLISAILLLIVQQCMFIGMSISVGTKREQNRNFSSLKNNYSGGGVSRVMFGRGAVYWLIFMIIAVYVAFIVPHLFGFPQRGSFWNIYLLLLLFVTDCVFFSMFWSTFIFKREAVFILFMFMSPICLFLTGFSWPKSAFPDFWRYFSYLFPTTFGCKAFIDMNTAGGDLWAVQDLIYPLIYQTIGYYILAAAMIYVENYILKWRKKRTENIKHYYDDMVIIRQQEVEE